MDISKLTAAQAKALLKEMIENGGEAQKSKIHFKVSDKGTLMLFGIRRGPIPLYGYEWLAILSIQDEIREALKTHKSKLEWKDVGYVKTLGLKKP